MEIDDEKIENDALVQHLKKINRHLPKLQEAWEKEVSFKHNILISIVRGVGYAIGASIVASILAGIVIWIIRSADTIPFLDQYIDPQAIEESLPPPEKEN